MSHEASLSFTELAKRLRQHPSVKNEQQRRDITDQTVEQLFHQVRHRWKVSRHEFERAVLTFCERKDLWDPMYFLKNSGFDDDGMCKIAQPNPETKYNSGGQFFAVPHEQRVSYCIEHKASCVNSDLQYIIIDGMVVS